jgi:OOP family OmpA-OmpF porin
LRASRLLAAAMLTVLPGSPWAQANTPSSQEMVDQLRQPRTRSLRNLIVEPGAKEGSAGSTATPGTTIAIPEAPPSLSLLIQFGFDSAVVQPESGPALQNLARALQTSELSNSRFLIEGHTDARGRADYNMELSRRRAMAVREALARNGASVERLEVVGKGSTDPADPADPRSALNRRVRIVNLD